MKPNENDTSRGPEPPAPELSLEEKTARGKGLRILARMIARAYIKDLKKKRLAELGVCPKFFIERIYISIDCVDMNDGKERQRLHQAIDEAINEAARQDLPENSLPFVLKMDDIKIRIYC